MSAAAFEDGERWALAEKAESVSVVKTVEAPSSAADKIIDWIPIGLMKYRAGEPGPRAI